MKKIIFYLIFTLLLLLLFILSYKNKKIIAVDVYIILTIFMRDNLQKQLNLISRQSIISSYAVHIIVFQSGSHKNISSILYSWINSHNFDVSYIHSSIETGFYGRFLAPIISYNTNNSYFIICDDDVIWGYKYFENMIRVVDSGSLAVRMGRLINKYSQEIIVENIWKKQLPVTYNQDIEYDYGGHIWAGKMKWIRDLWKYPPPTIHTSEDFWISAVLKVFYNITTKKPMCPSSNINIKPDLCACSDNTQKPIYHEPLHLGGKIIYENRSFAIDLIRKTYNVPLLLESDPYIIQNINKIYSYNTTFIVKGDYMENCLYYV